MAQLSDDCFAHEGALLRTGDALAALTERLQPVAGSESVPLRAALGRVLAEDVIAGRDVPPHDNSAVDGYAVYFDDLDGQSDTSLPVGGRAAAGHPLDRPAQRGEAIRIFTGAPMPDGEAGGPDTVLMQEDCRIEDGRVVIPPGIARGANRRRRGEDVQSGQSILAAGLRLRAQDIGLAASIGCATLPVRRLLKVALFSTGDEVFDPATDTARVPSGGIYDANRYCLMALLQGLGCGVTDLGILPDQTQAIRDVLAPAAAGHDLIITSGGMSVGDEDHVRAAVEALGQLHFWSLAIKPGRPVAMGQIGTTPFFGLPGNPVAMMVTFLYLARPAILRLAGASALEPHRYRVRAGFDYAKKPNRREFVRVRLSRDVDGEWTTAKFPREGAGILDSMVAADGLVELPEDLTQLKSGTMVDFLPFTEVMP